jgi:hypothetical protein
MKFFQVTITDMHFAKPSLTIEFVCDELTMVNLKKRQCAGTILKVSSFSSNFATKHTMLQKGRLDFLVRSSVQFGGLGFP